MTTRYCKDCGNPTEPRRRYCAACIALRKQIQTRESNERAAGLMTAQRCARPGCPRRLTLQQVQNSTAHCSRACAMEDRARMQALRSGELIEPPHTPAPEPAPVPVMPSEPTGIVTLGSDGGRVYFYHLRDADKPGCPVWEAAPGRREVMYTTLKAWPTSAAARRIATPRPTVESLLWARLDSAALGREVISGERV